MGRRVSIATIVILIIVVIVSFFLTAIGWMGYRLYSAREREALRTFNSVLADQASTALAVSLWNFDRAQSLQTIESFMKDRRVYAIIVKDFDSLGVYLAMVRDSGWQPVLRSKEVSLSGFLSCDRTVQYSGKGVGRVTVVVSPVFLEHHLTKVRSAIALSVALISLILILALYLLLWRIVLKPLKLLDRYALEVSRLTGNASVSLTIPFRGELDTLRVSMSAMVAQLKSRYAELHQQTRRVEESERKRRAIFDLSFGFIGLLTPEGILLEANKTALDFIGAAGTDVIGRPFWETPWWTHSADVQKQIRTAVEAAAKGEFVRAETTHRSKDGTLHIVDFTLKPITDEQGHVIMLIPEGRDITERQQSEEALQKQSRMQELLMNMAATYINLPLEALDAAIYESLGELSGFVEADRANIFRYDFNKNIASATHEWFAKSLPSLIAHYQEISLAKMVDWDAGAHRRGEPIYIPDTSLLPRGALRDIFERAGTKTFLAVPFMNAGDCVGFVDFAWVRHQHSFTGSEQQLLTFFAHMLVNIRNRREIDKELFESKERFRQMAENIEEVFFLYQKEGNKLLYMSPVITRLFGVDIEAVKADPGMIERSVHPEDLPHTRFTDFESFFSTPLNEEFRIITPDNAIRWIRMRSFPIHDSQGAVVRVAGLAADITEFKLAQEETRRQQQQLIQADKMASLGVMVSGIAHEINNPNNFITMSMPLLRQAWENVLPVVEQHQKQGGNLKVGNMDFNEFSQNFDKLMHGIEGGAERIKRIVDDLKDYARIDSMDLNQMFDLNEVVQSSVNLMNSMIRKRTKAFSMILFHSRLPVKGNKQRLEQVIINLIHNACDALMSVEQSISVSTQLTGENQISLVITDQGCGIAAADLQKIFDPFFTTKREKGGTGLGLSISAGIVKDHGGELRFESEKGKGTRATLLLPCGGSVQ